MNSPTSRLLLPEMIALAAQLERDVFCERVPDRVLIVHVEDLDLDLEEASATHTHQAKEREQADAEPHALPLAKRPGSNPFQGMITLGRSPNNDIVLPDLSVSKFHAYFRESKDSLTVSDAGSTNLTEVEGAKLEKGSIASVAPGNEIRFGDVLALYFDGPTLWSYLREGIK